MCKLDLTVKLNQTASLSLNSVKGIIKHIKTNLSLSGGDPGEEHRGVGPNLLAGLVLSEVVVVEPKVVVGLGVLGEVLLHERQLGALLEIKKSENVSLTKDTRGKTEFNYPFLIDTFN